MAVKAKELMDEIVSTKPVAEVENDKKLYAKHKAWIETDEDGFYLFVQTVMGIVMGNYRVVVGGVVISVSREFSGLKDDFSFSGEEIAYEDGVTEADLIKVIKKNVKFSRFDAEDYNDIHPDELKPFVELDEGAVFAEDDEGCLQYFDDEDDVPDNLTRIDSRDAVHRIVEDWVESGNATDFIIVQSFDSSDELNSHCTGNSPIALP